MMYQAVTRGISVTVTPRYMPEESSPDESRYFFAYTVEIINTSLERVQLKARYWRIVDAHGHLQEVRGAGVVGEQPVLGPGESYSYTSGCPLTTPSGTMEGSYVMETADGDTFEAEIPAFSLDIPQAKRVLH
jgi:ApaG protein